MRLLGYEIGKSNPFDEPLRTLMPADVELRSTLSDPQQWLVDWANMGGLSASGQVITERNAVAVTTVFRCVNVISDSLSAAPLTIYERERDAEGNDVGREQLDDHPLHRLLHDQPNPEMTAMTFRHVLQGHLLIWGNGYAEIERDGAGRPIALWPLRPDRTFPKRMQIDGSVGYINMDDYGRQHVLDSYDVLHLMGFSFDGLRGYSPIALHREAIGLARACEDYAARFFGNDSRPGGVLEHPQRLKPEAAKRLKESWEELHRGGEKSWRIAVLEEGMKWQSVATPNEASQFNETRKLQILEVCRIFGVPPHKVMDLERATFTNIESQAIEFVQDAVMPWAERWEQEIWRKLLLPSEQADYFVEHNLDYLLRGDAVTRNQAYSDAWTHGRMSINEIRRIDNLDPVEDPSADRHWVPSTMMPIDAIAARADQPAQPLPFLPLGGKPSAQLPAESEPPSRSNAALLYAAHAHVFQILAERVVRKEASAVGRAAKSKLENGTLKPFSDFLASFYGDDHRRFISAVFLPGLSSLAGAVYALFGERVKDLAECQKQLGLGILGYADDLAARLANTACDELGAAIIAAPGRARQTVEMRLAAWSRERPREIAEKETRSAGAYFAQLIESHFGGRA